MMQTANARSRGIGQKDGQRRKGRSQFRADRTVGGFSLSRTAFSPPPPGIRSDYFDPQSDLSIDTVRERGERKFLAALERRRPLDGYPSKADELYAEIEARAGGEGEASTASIAHPSKAPLPPHSNSNKGLPPPEPELATVHRPSVMQTANARSRGRSQFRADRTVGGFSLSRTAFSPPPPGIRSDYFDPQSDLSIDTVRERGVRKILAALERRRPLDGYPSKADELYAEIEARTGGEEEASTASIAHPSKAPLPPRPNSTPLAREQTSTGLLRSIFRKKKQMDTFHGSIEEGADYSPSSEQTTPTIKIQPRMTNIGLATVFPYEELNEATDHFTRELADGGFSRVYLGKLRDKRIVAVKVLYEGIPKRLEQFLNEVNVLSRLRHKNLVSLYGCTDPETQKLLLVYEFVPNGTVADHLHGQLAPLTWAIRIQIAMETAEALAYLHSREPPIIHRDVKTSNILLDNDFHAKVADLGMCRLVPWDTSTVSTQPQGTLGYRDPESDLYCVLSEKSDVYSLGVVLLELISGQQAVDVYREKKDIYLFNMALKLILNNELEKLVDPKLRYHSDTEITRKVNLVAGLACRCLEQEGIMRPSMVEVLTVLKAIRDGDL